MHLASFSTEEEFKAVENLINFFGTKKKKSFHERKMKYVHCMYNVLALGKQIKRRKTTHVSHISFSVHVSEFRKKKTFH